MLDGTYTGLKASAADFLNRDDLTAVIPDFIAMAEAQIGRRLIKDGPVRQMMTRNASYSVAAELVAVPADFEALNAIYLSANYLPLDLISPEELVRRKTLYPNTSGDPQAVAVVGSNLQFWPWASGGSFTATLVYWQTIPPLATNSSNWLLTKHPDIYLYTTLIQSAPYLRDDERLQVWGAIAETAITDLIAADKVARTAPNLGVGIVLGGTP